MGGGGQLITQKTTNCQPQFLSRSPQVINIKEVTTMRFNASMASRTSVMIELLRFFWASKWWWLTPMILLLLLLGVMLIFAQSSAVSPFIYTLFQCGISEICCRIPDLISRKISASPLFQQGLGVFVPNKIPLFTPLLRAGSMLDFGTISSEKWKEHQSC